MCAQSGNRIFQQHTHHSFRVDSLQRMENNRVVGDYKLCTLLLCLVYYILCHIKGDKRLCDPAVFAAHTKPAVIVAFLQIVWCYLVYVVINILNGRHIFSPFLLFIIIGVSSISARL